MRHAPLQAAQQRLSFTVASHLGRATPTVLANISLNGGANGTRTATTSAYAPPFPRVNHRRHAVRSVGPRPALLGTMSELLKMEDTVNINYCMMCCRSYITLRVPRLWRLISVTIDGGAWPHFSVANETVRLPPLGAVRGALHLIASYEARSTTRSRSSE